VGAETGAERPVGRGRQRRAEVGDADGEFVGGVGVDGVVGTGSSHPGSETSVGVPVGVVGEEVGVEDGVVSPGSPLPGSAMLMPPGAGVEDGTVSPGSSHPGS